MVLRLANDIGFGTPRMTLQPSTYSFKSDVTERAKQSAGLRKLDWWVCSPWESLQVSQWVGQETPSCGFSARRSPHSKASMPALPSQPRAGMESDPIPKEAGVPLEISADPQQGSSASQQNSVLIECSISDHVATEPLKYGQCNLRSKF